MSLSVGEILLIIILIINVDIIRFEEYNVIIK